MLVADGIVVRVAQFGEIETQDDVEVVDASGLYLLPGLIDVHAHLGDGGLRANTTEDLEQALGQFVRYGVTAVFVPGGGQGNDVQLRDWKLHCAENPGSCPRLFGSGSLITAYGSHPITTIWALPADSDPELIRARGAIGITEQDSVDDLIQEKLSANVDALKIVVDDGPGPFAPKPRLSRAKVAEICTKAHAEGLRVFAHISLAEHVDDVVDGNCDGIMHSPANPISKETLRKMAEGGVYYVPTLSIFDALSDQAAGRREHDQYALAGVSRRALESLQADEYWESGVGSPEMMSAVLETMKGNLSAASEAGVPIALGTDTDNPQVFPGFAVHEELELMVEGGLSEAEALKAATVTAAGFLDQHEHLGKLQSGFNADIVALRRNPLADIRNTRAIEFVVVGGARVSNAVAIP